MQYLAERLVLSPSDLVNYLHCHHLTELSVEVLDGRLARPAEDDPEIAVLSRHGIEHETRYLEDLKAAGFSVECISDEGDLLSRVALTLDAMGRGVDVIYQAAFLDDGGDGPAWSGYADFLRRVEAPSALGDFAYEPEDAKLARRVKPAAVIQLCAYAEQLERVQGRAPEQIHVKLGSGERETVRLADYAAYYRAAKQRFLGAVAAGVVAYPDPVEHCHVCVWRQRCDDQRLTDDHLSTVPGLRADQARKLRDTAGVHTVAALAGSDCPVDGIASGTLDKLRRQARLLVQARGAPESAPPYELLGPVEAGRGLGALPAPSAGDLFFDIESDPFLGTGGLEYLFGLGWEEPGGNFEYKALWAHNEAEEKASFEALIDLITERLERYPDMHVYHYAGYEPAALGRLMGRYGTREDEVDSLFRGGVLVDLYQVVRQALCVGAHSYSLKKIEALYLDARTQAITDGGSSIAEYERWLEEGDPQILEELENYNRTDCDSTRQLRDFLEDRRPEYRAHFGDDPPRPPQGVLEPPDAVLAAATENSALKEQLAQRTNAEDDESAEATLLLGELLDWFRREAKPGWWKYFDRVLRCDEADLYEDAEAIAGLVHERIDRTELKSYVHRYRFDPAQEHKLAVGQRVRDPGVERARILNHEELPGPGTLLLVDSAEGILELKRSINSRAAHPRCLIPEGPLRTDAQRAALRRMAEAVIAGGIDGAAPYRAGRDLLLRRPPRNSQGHVQADLRLSGENSLDAMVRIAGDLEGGALAVQGPPGSGKTFSAAEVAVNLVERGRSVGVTANSHAVITNVLEEIMSCASKRSVAVRASQKAEDAKAIENLDVEVRSQWQEVLADFDAGAQVVAGTGWLLAREDFDQRLDYLIVDEAGQLSLANVLAVGTCARNIILVGDPRQLAQPSQGSHPPGAEASGLGHLLHGAETMPPALGLFMEHTRRLHPEICAFVSEVVYEGRLESLPGCEHQAVGGGGPLGGSGLRWVPVTHAGNRVSSPEEADTVRALFSALLGGSWTNRHEQQSPIGVEDILVVAPYNAQVTLLRNVLPLGARIGTVDKFQGQEAPVVIVSLATSSAEEVPRGMEFLFSRERLNVAVSRAQALAVMVGSPELLTVSCRSVEQLRLANGLCRYVELALQAAAPPIPDVPVRSTIGEL